MIIAVREQEALSPYPTSDAQDCAAIMHAIAQELDRIRQEAINKMHATGEPGIGLDWDLEDVADWLEWEAELANSLSSNF
jgi:hypothetical protein